jgi:hypothetical protein
LLKAALDDQQHVNVGNEDALYGAEVRVAAWKPPATITEGMIDVAQSDLRKLQPYLEPASPDGVSKWLVQLGMVTAGKDLTPAETRAKAMLYVNLLTEFPDGVFKTASLNRAVDNFKWFPTANELREFLKAETVRLNNHVGRLSTIVETGPRQGQERPKWTKEDAEAHAAKLRAERDAERAALARAIAEQDAGLSVPGCKANKPSMRRLSVPSAADMRAAYAVLKRTGDE